MMNESIVEKKIVGFEPIHIFECGQCFRWNREDDGSYTGVAHGKALNVKREGESIIFKNAEKADFNNIWDKYFDLKRDYSIIEKKLSQLDDTMKRAVVYGHGIRILNQDPWETLISFIISANNGIGRIKGIVEALSENYGDDLGVFMGKRRYSFPTAQRLAKLKPEDVRACGAGYRDKYIINAASLVSEDGGWLEILHKKGTPEARKKLMELKGIGPKVADCILLFSIGKMDAFPVDVWVKRTMEYFYLPQKSTPAEINRFADEYFGETKGFAQQYLFYYARANNIGK